MKSVLTALWILFSSVFGLVILAEVYFRFLEEHLVETPETRDFSPEGLRQRSLQYRPAVYARHIFPAIPQAVQSFDGGPMAVNEKGYRGPDFSTEKKPGITRIIVYGGSSAFNLGASDGKDWPRLVEAKLKDAGIANIEVINAGIPGHATTDSVSRLMTEGHFLGPDYVLLYQGWNDIKYFTWPEPILRVMRPLKPNPLLYYQGSLDRFLGETLESYGRVRNIYLSAVLDLDTEGAIDPWRDVEDDWELATFMETAQSDARGIYESGPKQFELNIRNFVSVVRNIGATPILVRQARLVHPGNTDTEKERIRYDYVKLDHAGLVQAFETIDRLTERIAREQNVLWIDTRSVPKDLETFYDHIHLRPQGAEALASIIADALAPLMSP